MSVTLVGITDWSDEEIIFRHLQIYNTVEHDAPPRDVFQLNYLGWPDFGVPSSTRGIRELAHTLDFFKQIGHQNGLYGPCVVHCSAGVGRTGSFLATKCVMENPDFKINARKLREQIKLSVLDNECIESLLANLISTFKINQVVLSLRSQRNCGTVQTPKQYEYIYSALKDEIINPGPSEFAKNYFAQFENNFSADSESDLGSVMTTCSEASSDDEVSSRSDSPRNDISDSGSPVDGEGRRYPDLPTCRSEYLRKESTFALENLNAQQ